MVVFKEGRVIGFLLQIIAIGFQVKDCDNSYFSSSLVEDTRLLFYARMRSSARAGLVWLSQLGKAVYCVKEEMMKALTNVMVRILIGLDL